MVIQPSTAQPLVVELEADRFDQVQRAATVGAEANDIAGIGRNFRLKEDDVKHARLQA
ncbi:hypothetical protein D3C79_995860 [compost metagenome]